MHPRTGYIQISLIPRQILNNINRIIFQYLQVLTKFIYRARHNDLGPLPDVLIRHVRACPDFEEEALTWDGMNRNKLFGVK